MNESTKFHGFYRAMLYVERSRPRPIIAMASRPSVRLYVRDDEVS